MLDEMELSMHMPRAAKPGYWPWFVKITMNDNYLCDGTLINEDTVLVQAGCLLLPEFSGDYQQHRNVSVVLGTVRYNRDNHQARRYHVNSITSLKSSSLEQKVSIIRLNNSVALSAHVRPVCYNANMPSPSVGSQHERSLPCVLLQLNYDTDQLQHRKVNIVELAKCWPLENNNNNNTNRNVQHQTIRSSHDICVETHIDNDTNNRFYCGDNNNNNCLVGSIGGGHLYCRYKHNWHLFGIERRTMNTTTTLNKAPQLMLFEMLPRLLSS